MVVSNEPGYYKKGCYGIRIENLLAVCKVDMPGSERSMLEFETLTLAPIDRTVIDVKLLNGAEKDWLNDYHQTVFAALSAQLDDPTREWLDEVTKPI